MRIRMTPGCAERSARASVAALLPALAMALALALGGCTKPQTLDGRPTPQLADAALTAGYPQMALTVSNRILASDPRNVPALVARGDALYASGRSDEAGASYRQALAVAPNDAAASAGLGRILVRSDPHAAERLFRTALATHPDDPRVLANLGVALDLEQRHIEAQAEYRRALALAPDVAATKNNLGLSLALSGDSAGAERLLGPLAAAPDASPSVHDNLAVARMLARAPAGGSAQPATAPPAIATPGAAPTPLTPPASAPASAPASTLAPQAAAGAAFFVQLAAADSHTGAEAAWRQISGPGRALLSGHTPQIVQSVVRGRSFWRLRVPMASRGGAQALCDKLHAEGVRCWVTTVQAE